MRVSLDDIGARGPDHVFVGINERGELVYHDRSFKPHALVSGQTRGGKGGFFQAVNAHDCRVGSEMYVIAPDPGEYGWLDGRASVGDEERAPSIIRAVHRKMNQRRTVLAETMNPLTGTKGLANGRQLENRWHHIVLTVDEAPAVAGDEARLTYEPEELDEIRTKLASIAKRGAKVDVYLLLGSQYPTIESTFGAGSFGGGIKSQLQARIHFDRNSQSLYSVFDNGGAMTPETERFLRQGQPGRAAYSMLNATDGGDIRAVQVVWIEPQNIRQFALKYQGPTPEDIGTPTIITPREVA